MQGGKQQVSDENALKKEQDVKTTRVSRGEVKCKIAMRCQFSERALSEASFMVSLPNRLWLD